MRERVDGWSPGGRLEPNPAWAALGADTVARDPCPRRRERRKGPPRLLLPPRAGSSGAAARASDGAELRTFGLTASERMRRALARAGCAPRRVDDDALPVLEPDEPRRRAARRPHPRRAPGARARRRARHLALVHTTLGLRSARRSRPRATPPPRSGGAVRRQRRPAGTAPCRVSPDALGCPPGARISARPSFRPGRARRRPPAG